MKKFYDCGIDLGTTNSCISVPNNDTSCTIIDNIADRMQVTPSAVWIRGERTIVGQRALSSGNNDTVKKEFKRDMGTNTSYKIQGKEDSISPIELSAEVLKSLRRDAEHRLNRAIKNAVVTVPAAFNTVQCEATKDASKLAGFNNTILLQEPIAAAIAYGVKPGAKDQYWLVFDYGGGTLDVSIISTCNGRLDNITSKGNNHMGGKDLDRILFDRIILPQLQNKFNLNEPIDSDTISKLMVDVEKCKIELSNSTCGFFETYTAIDNEGKNIDIELKISRSQFEKEIYDEIQKAVNIAKETVISSGLQYNELDRIILVGGSTYIPLVKRLLTETFNMDLDCSLNPMTVVSQGAAIYAGTIVIEDDNTLDTLDDCYAVQLEYEPITSKQTNNVVGKINNYNSMISKIKIDCVENIDSESFIWTSGWCDFIDCDNGVFDIDVQICNLSGKNIYKISSCTKDGSLVDLKGFIFEIIYNELSMKFSAPPLPHSIGFMVTDGKDNYIDWVFKKDTKLPVKSNPLSYKLTKNLNSKEDGEFNIYIYEGENSLNPVANDLIRKVHIRSNELSVSLPAGTEIEITLEIDENRCGKVSGYIPLYDYELVEENLSSSNENYIDYLDQMVIVESKFIETDQTIHQLKTQGIELDELEKKYNDIKQLYDKYYDLININNDDVHRYISDFYDIQTLIIKKERDSREIILDKNSEKTVKRMDNNISLYGSSEQKDQYNQLKEQSKNASKAEKEHYDKKMRQLESNVVFNNIEWLQLVYIKAYKKSTNYIDLQKANYWKAEANRAIEDSNTELLSKAINILESLRIKSANESINLILSDLKK